jgi:hypothetical protein
MIVIRNFHLRIIPDDNWEKRMKEVLETLVADFKDVDFELDEN